MGRAGLAERDQSHGAWGGASDQRHAEDAAGPAYRRFSAARSRPGLNSYLGPGPDPGPSRTPEATPRGWGAEPRVSSASVPCWPGRPRPRPGPWPSPCSGPSSYPNLSLGLRPRPRPTSQTCPGPGQCPRECPGPGLRSNPSPCLWLGHYLRLGPCSRPCHNSQPSI